jgi:hypothetical protein
MFLCKIGQILELTNHNQILAVNLPSIQIVFRSIGISYIDSNRDVGEDCPDEIDRLNSSIKVFFSILDAYHVGHHDYLGIFVIDDGLAFFDPILEFCGGVDLEENRGVIELIDEFIEYFSALIGLVVNPKDVIID